MPRPGGRVEARLKQIAGEVAQGEAPRARELWLEMVAETPPEDIRGRVIDFGQAALRDGRYADAAFVLAAAIEISPGDAQIAALAGAASLNGGAHERSVALLLRAFALSPDVARVAAAAGSALLSVKRWDAAETLLRSALGLEPDFADARYNLGVALIHLRRYREACTVLADRLPDFGALDRDVGRLYALLLQSHGLARGASAPVEPDEAPPVVLRSVVSRARELRSHSKLNNVTGADDPIQPCLACGAVVGNHLVGSAPVDAAGGLFVDDPTSLAALYCDDHAHAPYYRQVVGASLGAFGKNAAVGVAECAQCGVFYQNFPHNAASVDRFYAANARAILVDSSGRAGRIHDLGWLKDKLPLARYLWRRCGLARGARVLDIGCADGTTLWYLNFAGAEGYGIEPSVQAVQFAREILGLERVAVGSYGESSYAAGMFDCIYSHHVLEHAASPMKILRAAVCHLKGGGHFLVQVPWGRRRPDGRVDGIGQGHLFAFTPEFLTRALEAIGVRVVEVNYFESLDELPISYRDASGRMALWGDGPGSLSVLAVKPG